MSFEELQSNVIQWATDRKIIPNGTPSGQLMKAVSEMGELCDAHGKGDVYEIEDAIGDILVCLINYCELQDMDIVDCLAGAYDQIKDRKGTLMPDGTFVKDAV
jgi:hypothetical protein